MLSRRYFLIGSAIVALLVVALLVWQLLFAPATKSNVITAGVTQADLEQTVVATGTLEPQQLVSVGAQASGRLETLAVALGQTVHKGELIAEIDAQTQTNALRTAKAALADVRAQRAAKLATLAKTELAFKRQQMMVAGEATSYADYESAQADLKSARADVNALDAQIREAQVSVSTAQVNLAYTRIVAPMDGVVVSVVTKQGQTVNANQTAPTIVILAKLTVMTIKAEVSEADVIKVKPGLPVYFTILGDPDHRYGATLRQIEPAPESIVNEVNSSSSTTSSSSSTSSTSSSAIYYNALFEVANTDGRLRALMTAQVSIVLALKKNVLQIPSTALGARGKDGRYTVRVQDADGEITTRQVRFGLNNNVAVEVLDGLKAGEKVVVGEASASTSTTNNRPMGPGPM